MAKPAAYEVIQPVNPLRAKVGPPRPTDPGLIARAEAALQDMAGDYLGWVANDLAALEAGAAAFTAAVAPASRIEALQSVYGVVHDIKGQGATFDFKLVTGIAGSLCRYLERTAEIGGAEVPADPEIVGAHVDALRAVIGHGVKGDGGSLGREVESGLAKAIQRSLDRAKSAAPR
ncbi:hypothetical protein [Desertibaculum subflavum]|uniref:hypothetical protein n=1 Tax=Desertibaculum subflavum TaxID=2268458 RepID=UPI000E674A22